MKAKGRLLVLCLLAVVWAVSFARQWAEARLDAWVDREEAKAAQPWRRTP